MLGVNIVAADTDHEARRLFTSHQQIFLALRRGTLGPVPPPVDPDRFDAELTPLERLELDHVFSSAHRRIARDRPARTLGVPARTDADEIIIAAQIFDHGARLRSFEIVAETQTVGSRQSSVASHSRQSQSLVVSPVDSRDQALRSVDADCD